MDADVFMNFVFALVIVVTVLSFGTVAGKRNREFKLQKLEMEARIAEANATKPNAAQADIEDRLRVLERIVTDPANNLSQQIEDLRSETAESK